MPKKVFSPLILNLLHYIPRPAPRWVVKVHYGITSTILENFKTSLITRHTIMDVLTTTDQHIFQLTWIENCSLTRIRHGLRQVCNLYTQATSHLTNTTSNQACNVAGSYWGEKTVMINHLIGRHPCLYASESARATAKQAHG